jgi:hypothetical protein
VATGDAIKAAELMTDGFLCGWRVQSELRLPELAPWAGDDRPPDIVIRFGAVPERLHDSLHAQRALQIDRQGTCLLRVKNIAAYLVNPGEVVVAPFDGADEAEIRVFLLGSVFGFLCHQRGLFPLHASCVAIGGKAVALCGPTGAGKSTTATHLAMRGHRLVADDVCVIDAHAAGGPRVLPAFPRLKLTQEALAGLKIPNEGLERDRLGALDKFHYTPAESFIAEPVPLGGIFLLRRAAPGAPEECIRLARPAEKIAMLSAEVFRPRAAAALRSAQSMLRAQAAIAAATPIWRISRHFDLAAIGRWLGQIETLVGS